MAHDAPELTALRREVEAKLTEVAKDIEEIRDRLSPTAVGAAVRAEATDRMHHVADRVVEPVERAATGPAAALTSAARVAREHPVAAAATGAGVAATAVLVKMRRR